MDCIRCSKLIDSTQYPHSETGTEVHQMMDLLAAKISTKLADFSNLKSINSSLFSPFLHQNQWSFLQEIEDFLLKYLVNPWNLNFQSWRASIT